MYGIKIEVSGDWAIFTRPELKGERVSYECMTPSAARGIVSSIYWKPSIRWYIDRITVCNPISFMSVMRNEVGVKGSFRVARTAINSGTPCPSLDSSNHIQQRSSLILKDVKYIIEAHFILTPTASANETAEKHYQIAKRRMKRGQCFQQPFLGCREFHASFRYLDESDCVESSLIGYKDLGIMLYDLSYPSELDALPVPMYFYASLRDGVLDLRNVRWADANSVPSKVL